MINIINLVMLYVAIVLTTLLHEIGHIPSSYKIRFGLFSMPKNGGIRVRLLPLPEAAAMQARFRLGGLLMNFLIFFGVYYFKPTNNFLQLIGAVAFIHFVLYTFFGSINKELSESYIKKHPSIVKYWIFDDIDNNLAWLFISLSIITLLYFKGYYFPILIGLL